jgi:hypothetical protein
MDQDDDKTFTATIHKLVRQFHSVATPENIRGSFVRAGFSYTTGAIPYVLEFSREGMRESAGFRHVWELDIPLGILWTRRQKAQFGLLNETGFQPSDEKEPELNRTIAKLIAHFSRVLNKKTRNRTHQLFARIRSFLHSTCDPGAGSYCVKK